MVDSLHPALTELFPKSRSQYSLWSLISLIWHAIMIDRVDFPVMLVGRVAPTRLDAALSVTTGPQLVISV